MVQGWLLASNSTAVSPVGPSHAAITGDLLDALLWHSPLAAVSAAAVALPAAPPSHHSMTTASYLPHRSATRLHCRSAAAATATVALLLRTAQLRLHCCRFAIAATPRRSATSAPAAATAPLRCGRVAQLLLSYSPPPLCYCCAPLHCRVAPLRAAPRHSATCCQLCTAPPRCCRAASLLPRRFAATALEPIAVRLGAFQNMLSIMYSGSCLLQHPCFLCIAPCTAPPSVLDVTIMIRVMVCVVTVTVVVSIVIHTSRMQELSAGCSQ